MKLAIQAEIESFVEAYRDRQKTQTAWGIPLVGFASADDPRFAELKSAVSPTHALPGDFLGEAASVVAYFLPFLKTLSASNRDDRLASEAWAIAYIETNRLLADLGRHLKTFLEAHGSPTHIFPTNHNFDKERLVSDWSHRHVARIAGLGNFGLNHMLITSQGCCGRVGSLITTDALEPDTAEVCGKCVVGLPCTHCNPVKVKNR